ncbi:phosphotransferase enzyme family protein [Methylophaga muralis]|uniref:Phosphotransferase enzyme family protein n=1 Tax=Methylophaga muralis TaxID=291169 RepID=A0A1E3GNL8_9GAMM|nr:phosphotransferase [Methylophaga muralis]ODN65638.1 Phosphotransferase enzyme family protein [Methylophaga muralis]
MHADLRLANLLVDDKQLSVIDFDDCGFSWFIYDFASAVSFLETSPLLPELQQAWVRGYKSIAALSAEDEAMISTLVMFRRLLLTAWVASHPETPTAAEAGFEQFTFGTIELAKKYLQQQAEEGNDLTEKRILDMNAFEAKHGGHAENVARRLNNLGAARCCFIKSQLKWSRPRVRGCRLLMASAISISTIMCLVWGIAIPVWCRRFPDKLVR